VAVSKDELLQAAFNEMSAYPNISLRYQIGDPLIKQYLQSMAAMLADVSNQIEVTAGEVYGPSRDSTILADAAVKGVLPFATPTIDSVSLVSTFGAIQVLAGRSLIDQAGRSWRVTTGGTATPDAPATVVARQVTMRTITHTVTKNTPFYTVELAQPDVGYIAEVAVDGYTYTAEFCNVQSGDPVYHIKSDENQIMSVMFGIDGLAGKQPATGEVLTITIYDTEGDIAQSVGGTFAFEYINAGDQFATMKLAEVKQAGAAPMSLETLREVCSFPGIFSRNAVMLANFDFLVRENVQSLTFLSVWNETREEQIRGYNVKNINKLFFSVLRDGTEPTTLQEEVKAVVLAADDSYRFGFVDPVAIELPLILGLTIPSTFDSAAVLQSVRALILSEYGRNSAWARRGEAKILRKDLYALIKDNIPALTQRLADMTVDTGEAVEVLPEHFRYVTEASLQVVPTSENF
jgi:hypothetical protein